MEKEKRGKFGGWRSYETYKQETKRSVALWTPAEMPNGGMWIFRAQVVSCGQDWLKFAIFENVKVV